MKNVPSTLLCLLLAAAPAPAVAAQEAAAADPLAVAVLPLPTELREGAGVLRWTGPGETEQLRPSTNGMSCSADDPADDVLDVRCYHDDFWVAIRRASALRQTAESREELVATMAREAESGELPMPAAPTAGYRMLGPVAALDTATLAAGPEIDKWQSIHFPFRTAREMGLTDARELSEPGLTGLMPFVMASGTWWSHVMIVHESFR